MGKLLERIIPGSQVVMLVSLSCIQISHLLFGGKSLLLAVDDVKRKRQQLLKIIQQGSKIHSHLSSSEYFC